MVHGLVQSLLHGWGLIDFLLSSQLSHLSCPERTCTVQTLQHVQIKVPTNEQTSFSFYSISITKSVLPVPHGIYIHTKNIPAISRRNNQYAKQTNLYLPMFCDENIFILKPSCEQTTCLLWLYK